MGDHVCMCMSAAWAIWKSHAFHVPKKTHWLSYMPHCQPLPLFPQFFFDGRASNWTLWSRLSRCRCWCRNWNPKPTPTTWHHVQISYARFCTILIFIQHLRFKWSRSCSWSLSCSWSCSFEFGDGDAQPRDLRLGEMRLCCHWMITLNMKSMKKVNDSDDVF